MARRSLSPQLRARGVTAVLGPTNTGKTHLAIERMLGHESGMIGLPLRLLAREVYGRVVERVGPGAVALVTGEEKIKPENPRYWISTVEAMPRDLDLAFVAIDEIQLAADLDRGHVFTDRLLNQRGRSETLIIGSATIKPLVEALLPGIHVVTRPRLSKLTFAGEKKISRLPPRSAIVAFSAEEVYAIAELIRRQRGGAAVVLGALSPRTRNAQVELYQSGDVDYLVATDAVGMGLNLDVDHVAFAADKKFDGFRFRRLFPAELGQIAGRAGRFMRDGTFGSSGRCPPFEPELIEALEGHHFDAARVLQWRNPDLDFTSLATLQESLAEHPREQGLTRAVMGEDVAALEIVAREDDIRGFASSRAAVERLWEVCQVPDYRKISSVGHAELVGQLYRFLMRDGGVSADWFNRQVGALDRTDGDIDALSNRIAQVRTWSFVANRPDWLPHPKHWQGVTRQVEDRLSDALHERLTSRFIDRRTSVLMRRLRENAMLEAEITATGDVTVEGQHVGQLHGFHFVPDPQAEGAEAKALLRNAAQKALAGEIDGRADRFASAADSALVLSNDGTIRWTGEPVAKLEPGEKVFEPRFRILADEQLTGPARDKVDGRLKAWLKAHIVRLLGPLLAMEEAADLTGLARGIGFQISEALGVLERSRVAQEMRSLDQDGRAALRRHGVRFGAYHLYLPALLKPAPRTLAAQLWALKNGGLDQKGIEEIAHLASSGRTSIPIDPETPKALYRAAGFRVCGGRAVRVDILERLADLIRPASAYRPGVTPGEPPAGAADGDGFVQTVAMTSLVGCSGEDFASILKSLGYAAERRPGPAITVPLLPAAATAPAPQPATEAAAAGPDAPADEPAAAEPAGTADEDVPAASAEPVPAAVPTSAEPGSPSPEPARENQADEASAPDASPASATSDAPTPDEPVLEAADVAVDQTEAVPDAGMTPAEPSGEVAQDGAPSALDLPVPSQDASAEAAPAPDAVPAPDAPAEPVLIEVWRQSRQHRAGGEQVRHPRGRHGRPDRGQRSGEGGRPPGTRPFGDRPAAGDRFAAGAGPDNDRPASDQPQATRPPGERPAHRRPDRPERRPDERGGRADRPPRPEGDGRPDQRGPRRPGRPDDRRGPPREHQGEARREGAGGPRPERRERAPDPNSPFAKLLALKAQLEGRDGDKR